MATTYAEYFGDVSTYSNADLTAVAVLLLVLFAWKVYWYGAAMYRSLDKKQKKWFVALFMCFFVIPFDLGIIAIIYLILNREDAKKIRRRR